MWRAWWARGDVRGLVVDGQFAVSYLTTTAESSRARMIRVVAIDSSVVDVPSWLLKNIAFSGVDVCDSNRRHALLRRKNEARIQERRKVEGDQDREGHSSKVGTYLCRKHVLSASASARMMAARRACFCQHMCNVDRLWQRSRAWGLRWFRLACEWPWYGSPGFELRRITNSAVTAASRTEDSCSPKGLHVH